MIKYSELEHLFSLLSFKCNEYNFEILEDIELPFATFVRYDGDPIFADGSNLFNLLFVRVILIDSEINSFQQQEIKDLLSKNEIPYSYNYSFNEEYRIHTTSFTFEVIDDSCNNNE